MTKGILSLLPLILLTGCISSMPPLGSSKVAPGFNAQIGGDARLLITSSDTTGSTTPSSTGSPVLIAGNVSMGIRERVEISTGVMLRPFYGYSMHGDVKTHLFHKGDETQFFRNISTALFVGYQTGDLEYWGSSGSDSEFRSGIIVSTFREGTPPMSTMELPLYLYFTKDSYSSNSDPDTYKWELHRHALNIGTGMLWSIQQNRKPITIGVRGSYRMPLKYEFYRNTRDEQNILRAHYSRSGGHEFNFSAYAQFHFGKRRRLRQKRTKEK